MKYANPLNLTIKALKTWNTHDGGGYQFTLMSALTTIARVHNDGNGGCTDIEPVGQLGKDIMAKLDAFCATLPKDESFGIAIDITSDIWLEELMSDFEAQKAFASRVARAKKAGNLVFTLPEDAPLSWRTVKLGGRPLENGVAYLSKKYGAGKFTVL
jgi:hypothetical protein